MAQQQSFLEKCYKDASGRVVLFQAPNLPIIVWLVTLVLSKLFVSGSVHDMLRVISFGALFTWAWLELFSGSNYLRRVLGFVVLVVTIFS